MTFQIQQEWFALSIRLVRKLTLMGPVYGATGNGSMGLTHFEHQEIPVIDAQYRIFGQAASRSLPSSQIPVSPAAHAAHASSDSSQRYLLVIQNRRRELVGIPLSAQPVLRRVPESAFAPLPAAYSANGSLRCVSAIAVLGPDQPSLFLLDTSRLIAE
ncbi:MAG: chemotaxis protein CheW [Elainellaceae cyanobacterium]